MIILPHTTLWSPQGHRLSPDTYRRPARTATELTKAGPR